MYVKSELCKPKSYQPPPALPICLEGRENATSNALCLQALILASVLKSSFLHCASTVTCSLVLKPAP